LGQCYGSIKARRWLPFGPYLCAKKSMKTLILLLFPIALAAQSLVADHFPISDEKIIYQEALEAEGTAEELSERAAAWAVGNGLPASTGVYRHYIKTAHNKAVQDGRLWYTLKIETKDGRYRYTLEVQNYTGRVVVQSSYTDFDNDFASWAEPSDKWPAKKRQRIAAAMEEYLSGIDKQFKDLIVSLNAAMATNDDW